MEELKALFENGTLDYDAFEKKASENGIKLANLASGAYVDVNKFTKLKKEFDEYKATGDSKNAEYEALKAEIETLKAEKLEAQKLNAISSAGVGEKFRKFVLTEVSELVDEKTDFETALKNYLKDNEQFIEQKQTNVFRFGSQVKLENGETPKNTSQKMNKILRGVEK